MKRRGRVDILADILQVVRSLPNSPMTRISYGANLPLDRAKSILSNLVRYGLVRLDAPNSSRRYRITSRGIEFLETYKRMKGFLSFLEEENADNREHHDM